MPSTDTPESTPSQARHTLNGTNLRVVESDIRKAFAGLNGKGVNRIMPHMAGRAVSVKSAVHPDHRSALPNAPFFRTVTANPTVTPAYRPEASTFLNPLASGAIGAGVGALAGGFLSKPGKRRRGALLGALAGTGLGLAADYTVARSRPAPAMVDAVTTPGRKYKILADENSGHVLEPLKPEERVTTRVTPGAPLDARGAKKLEAVQAQYRLHHGELTPHIVLDDRGEPAVILDADLARATPGAPLQAYPLKSYERARPEYAESYNAIKANPGGFTAGRGDVLESLNNGLRLRYKSNSASGAAMAAGLGALGGGALGGLLTKDKRDRLRNILAGAAGGAGVGLLTREAIAAIARSNPAAERADPAAAAALEKLEAQAIAGDRTAFATASEQVGATAEEIRAAAAGIYRQLPADVRAKWDAKSTAADRVQTLSDIGADGRGVGANGRAELRRQDWDTPSSALGWSDSAMDLGGTALGLTGKTMGLVGITPKLAAGLKALGSRIGGWTSHLGGLTTGINFLDPSTVHGDGSWVNPLTWGNGQTMALSHLAHTRPAQALVTAAERLGRVGKPVSWANSFLGGPSAAARTGGGALAGAKLLGNRLGALGTVVGTATDVTDWYQRGMQQIRAEDPNASAWSSAPRALWRGIGDQQREQDVRNSSDHYSYLDAVKGNLSHVPANFINFGRNLSHLNDAPYELAKSRAAETAIQNKLLTTAPLGPDFTPTYAGNGGIRYTHRGSGQTVSPDVADRINKITQTPQ